MTPNFPYLLVFVHEMLSCPGNILQFPDWELVSLFHQYPIRFLKNCYGTPPPHLISVNVPTKSPSSLLHRRRRGSGCIAFLKHFQRCFTKLITHSEVQKGLLPPFPERFCLPAFWVRNRRFCCLLCIRHLRRSMC